MNRTTPSKAQHRPAAPAAPRGKPTPKAVPAKAPSVAAKKATSSTAKPASIAKGAEKSASERNPERAEKLDKVEKNDLEKAAADKPAVPALAAEPLPAEADAALAELSSTMPLATKPSDAKGAAAVAERIIAEDAAGHVAELGNQLTDERPTVAVQAARILDELVARKPELVVQVIDRLAAGITSDNPRIVQTCAGALPHVARLAPARVARNLESLTDAFGKTSPVGKDGLVRTFAALCSASVAYQKRLEPVLDAGLSSAEPKTLARWTEIVLPALKGEPHARARAVVERRIPELPRPIAQKIADFLGIKLRRVQA